jgi:hypothetical protein
MLCGFSRGLTHNQDTMAEPTIREPEEIRQGCAERLRQVETTAMFKATLGCILGEDWTTPRIEELRLTRDQHLSARVAGQAVFQNFKATKTDLIYKIHEVAKLAGLDGDELGYLLGKVADLKWLK